MAEPSRQLLRRAAIGARKILTDCLSLDGGDVVTVFFDETTSATARIIVGEAISLRLTVRERYIPLCKQQVYRNLRKELSLEDRDAISSARAILTCLSNHPGTTTFRRELVSIGTDRGRRLGHMPGANVRLLSTAVNIDYARTSQECENLALVLSLGQQATLQSYGYGRRGTLDRPFDLRFALGGLNRPAITSAGLIPLGTWGNLPAGETFIAPIEQTADGIFALNGSFKDTVLSRPSLLLLSFERGRLSSFDGQRHLRDRFKRLLHLSRRTRDDRLSLAELGVGVNHGIRALTGTSLLDEKCAGTAHIAVGDNTGYGGTLSSPLHEDFITKRPSLWIDTEPILKHGRLVFNSAVWHPTCATTQPDPIFMNGDVRIQRTNIVVEKTAAGALRVRREVAAGRLCSYSPSDPETSVLLHRLYELIPRAPLKLPITSLRSVADRNARFEAGILERLLTILLRHRLIETSKLGLEGSRFL